MTFKELNLHEDVIASIDAMGYDKPTPIQEKAIPIFLEGKDLIGCAQTGTGKTAAFLLPLLHKICSEQTAEEEINALIICPTRELALQIDQQVEGFSYFTGVSSIPIYGGGDGEGFSREKRALSKGVNIVVGTPGKIISHLNLGYVKVNKLQHLILDEADRMLDMGFYEDITKIISFLPKERQTVLFSATMPPKIRTLTKEILKNPEEINIAISKPAEKIVQVAFSAYDSQKIALVKHLLRFNDIPCLVIFASTKSKVRSLTKELKAERMNVAGISSDLEQSEREQMLNDFKHRKLQILVATDVISRGIDIDNIDMVINFDVPNDPEDYIHRIGRTARAASEGEAVTFINEDDQFNFSRIEKLLGSEIRKIDLPENIGEGPVYNPSNRSKGKRVFHKNRKTNRR